MDSLFEIWIINNDHERTLVQRVSTIRQDAINRFYQFQRQLEQLDWETTGSGQLIKTFFQDATLEKNGHRMELVAREMKQQERPRPKWRVTVLEGSTDGQYTGREVEVGSYASKWSAKRKAIQHAQCTGYDTYVCDEEDNPIFLITDSGKECDLIEGR